MDDQSMTWRLWNVFSSTLQTGNGPFGLAHNVSVLRKVTWKISPIRTVHAAEVTEKTGDSTIDKLGQRKPTIYISPEEVNKILNEETGKDRLKELFRKRQDGTFHPDIMAAFSISETCGFMAAIPAFFYGGRAGRETYRRKNQHTKFKSQMVYARRINDAMFLGAIKTAIPFTLKTLGFTFMFWFGATTIASYRNKSSVLEYVISAGVTGAIFRSNLGVRGMVAGGVVGSMLGVVFGSCLYVTLKAFGETQQERHFWNIQESLRKKRELEVLLDVVTPEVNADITTSNIPQPS